MRLRVVCRGEGPMIVSLCVALLKLHGAQTGAVGRKPCIGVAVAPGRAGRMVADVEAKQYRNIKGIAGGQKIVDLGHSGRLAGGGEVLDVDDAQPGASRPGGKAAQRLLQVAPALRPSLRVAPVAHRERSDMAAHDRSAGRRAERDRPIEPSLP